MYHVRCTMNHVFRIGDKIQDPRQNRLVIISDFIAQPIAP
jgi:hypothetical protein